LEPFVPDLDVDVVGVPPGGHALDVLFAVAVPHDPDPDGDAVLAVPELGRFGWPVHVEDRAQGKYVCGLVAVHNPSSEQLFA
jgi:hypothetical protein